MKRDISTTALALLVVSVFSFVSCQSKLVVKKVPGKKGGLPVATTAPEPENPVAAATSTPVELPGAASGGRVYFQSRSTINLQLALAEFPQSALLDVENTTTSKLLIDGLNQHAAVSSAEFSFSRDGDNGNLSLFAGATVENESRNNKFIYGKNIIKILGDDGSASKFSTIELYLIDRPIFLTSTTFFPSGEQRDSGLEGGFEALPAAVLTNGVHTLVIGNTPIVTR